MNGEWAAKYLPDVTALAGDLTSNDPEAQIETILDALDQGGFEPDLLDECPSGITPFRVVQISIDQVGSIQLTDERNNAYSGTLNPPLTPDSIAYATLTSGNTYGIAVLLLVPAKPNQIIGLWGRIFWGINKQVGNPMQSTARFILTRQQTGKAIR